MKSKRCKLSSALRVFAILTLVLGFGIIFFQSYMTFSNRIFNIPGTYITSLLHTLALGSLLTLSISSSLHGLSLLLDYKTKVIENLHNTKIKLLKIRAIMVTITLILTLLLFLSELTGLLEVSEGVSSLLGFSIFTLPYIVILVVCLCISWTIYVFIKREKINALNISLKIVTLLSLILGFFLLAFICFLCTNGFKYFDSSVLKFCFIIITFGFLCVIVVASTLYGLSKLVNEKKASDKYLLKLKISSILGVILIIISLLPILSVTICLSLEYFRNDFWVIVEVLFVLFLSFPIVICLFLSVCTLGAIRRILKLKKQNNI